MRLVTAACALGVALWAVQARAWDDEGHMVVAALAWQDIGASQRSRVVQLLKLNPEYLQWIGGVPVARQQEVAFLMAATWPDTIKSNPDYLSDGQKPHGASSRQNIGYQDHLQHRYWHYIDEPLSVDGAPTLAAAEPNVATQIRLFEETLGSSASDDIKSYDLVWLEHLVGDVHQPLHTVSRFSPALPRGDQGGNLVELCRRPCRNELHAFWDTVVGTSRDPQDALTVATGIPKPPSSRASIADVNVWVEESVQAARKVAYAAPIGPGAGPYSLDDQYRTRALEEARERIALAGARLARLINSTLR
jgi:hypothetical protein